jgi:hypothetical protein
VGADVGGGARVKKARIAQLVDPAVHEGDAKEQTNWEQRPAQPVGVQLAAAPADGIARVVRPPS